MASIRRTLSPVPRPGLTNGEAVQAASPLSRSSSNNQNNLPTHSGGGLGVLPSSLDYTLYNAQNLILGTFSTRSSRPFDRWKAKVQSWRRSILHFMVCFMIGVFLGLTPFVSMTLSSNFVPNNDKQQAFNFDVQKPVGIIDSHTVQKSSEIASEDGFPSSSESSTSTSEPHRINFELKDQTVSNSSVSNDLFDQDPTSSLFHKLVIVVTPTRARPMQTYYLTRLAHTLRLVSNPLLWIVVEMNCQSMQTAELLRSTGVVYRHLVYGSNKNSSPEVMSMNVLMRNVALSHIETHRLDGIVYFADDDGMYSSELFQQMRQISRFGTWPVAKVAENQGNVVLEGPICNGTKVIGWHVVVDVAKPYQRFHADMSGFAFNSTIIWDPKRWHRPTLEAIRQIVAVKEDLQACAFIEQIVEDESQMECLYTSTSEVMVWHHHTPTHLTSYPGDSIMSSYSLGSIFPLL